MASFGKIARRSFLVGSAVIAGGLAFGYYKYKTPFENPLENDLDKDEATFNAYIKISKDSKVTIIVPRAEMGQGVTTTLAALVAEELDVELASVIVEHGPASNHYYNAAMIKDGGPFPHFESGLLPDGFRNAMGVVSKFIAIQATGGSTSTVDAFEKMRFAGCAAREILKKAAGDELSVNVSELETENGFVVHAKTGENFSYGSLLERAKGISPPADMVLRDKKNWKILGKSQPRTDLKVKVTGAPIYGIDVNLPDMVYATIKMSPKLTGKMVSFDTREAEKMRGFIKAVAIESQTGHGVGVIADNSWRAFKAADAIDIEWAEAPYPKNSENIYKAISAEMDSNEGFALRTIGDPNLVFADASSNDLITAEYRVPFLAHATMEPMNATAQFSNGKLEIWAPNQSPSLIKMVCAGVAGIDASDVHVHTTYLGGGFGRRIEVDFSIYATKLALETDGRPVKVTWTREEDIGRSVYRPTAVGRYQAVLGSDGFPKALSARVGSPSVIRSVLGRALPSIPAAGPDKAILEGSYDQPYEIENYEIRGVACDIPVPVGFWRSVGNSYNAFMQESFLDEIADKGKLDPVELRLGLMKPWPTAVAVLKKVAEMADWGAPLASNQAKGVAFTLSFGSWVAQVIQVSDVDGAIKIDKVWCAADAGTVLDPAIFKAQVSSAIIFGLSSAISQEITFEDGMVEQSNFHDYDALRISQAPEIVVEILENAEKMGGAGEIGTPPSIPAFANAIFALTGKRVRQTPFMHEVDFV